MRAEKRFGKVHPRDPVALFEFDREELESLRYLFGRNDGFYREVTEAMMWIDGLSEENE